jgi:hypothetical protein
MQKRLPHFVGWVKVPHLYFQGGDAIPSNDFHNLGSELRQSLRVDPSCIRTPQTLKVNGKPSVRNMGSRSKVMVRAVDWRKCRMVFALRCEKIWDMVSGADIPTT